MNSSSIKMGDESECAFSEHFFTGKLSKLNSSQQIIETLSRWCITYRKRAKRVVEMWHMAFKSAPQERQVSLLYLVNEILQISRRKGDEFLDGFWKVLPTVLNDVYDSGEENCREVSSKLINSSLVPSRKDISKVSDDKRKRDDNRRQSDRQSSRGYHRHDEHSSRRDKHVDDYVRGYSKPSYRSGKDYRSKDYANDVDNYSHAHRSRDKDSYDRTGHREDRSDRQGRTDHRTSSPAYEDLRADRVSGHRLKESSFRDTKEIDENDENKRREDRGMQGPDDASNKSQDSVAKKAKVFSMDSTGPGTIPDCTSEMARVTDSDIDAAKIAAMKAAELVNKNLVGTGYMSTNQKKNLLWGNKKKSAPEEGVKGAAKVENNKQDNNSNPDAEKQREQLQMELERQYTAGLRRRDGRTVGFGL